MSNPELPADDPLKGSFVLAALDPGDGATSPICAAGSASRWWNSPHALLGRFLGRWRARARSRRPRHRSARSLCGRTIAARRARRLHLPAGLAFSQSHPAPLRLERAPKGDEDTLHRQPLRHALHRRLGRRRIRRRTTCDALEKKTRLFAAALRESTIPAAVKDAASANLSTLVTHHLLPHRRRRVPRLRRRQRPSRLLPRQLHPRLELRNRDRAPLPHLRPLAARARPSATSWTTPAACASARRLPHGSDSFGLRRRRRPDGPDHARLSRLAPLRRHGLAPRTCGRASRRPSSSPGSPAAGTPTATASSKACSTTPTTWSSTAPIRSAASIIWARCAPAKRWRAPSATQPAAAEYRACSSAAASWIDANLFNGEYLHAEDSRRGQGQDRAHAASATWARRTPTTPQYQVGEGCLVDQLIGQYLADVAGLGPLRRAGQHPQDAATPSIATTTSAPWTATIACSAPTC